MARRRFELPGIQDLNKQQEEARNLPLEGQHLIVGGPGTGKSVLALLRAKRLHRENKEYSFLVYNHLLMQSSKILFRSGGSGRLNVDTEPMTRWKKWFFRIFKVHTGKKVPLTDTESDGWRPIIWDQVLDIASGVGAVNKKKSYLVIDEGQDMPPEFYKCLVILGFENLFVVADQNQQIWKENSTIPDLRDVLDLEPPDVIKLEKNYRNRYPVARLAREFYTGDVASPPPELPPPPSHQARLPVLYEYADEKTVIRLIAKMADRDPAKLLGVLTYKDEVRKRIYKALLSEEDGLDNGRLNVSTHSSKDRTEVAFDEGGIMVINSQACKGLEFDTVLIVGLNDFRIMSDDTPTKKLFYVMVARAIDTVVMFKAKDRHCPVDDIMPNDRRILERM